MGLTLITIAVLAVLIAAALPAIFLRKYPGRKMDEPEHRIWLIWMFVLVAVSLTSIVLIVTVTKTII